MTTVPGGAGGSTPLRVLYVEDTTPDRELVGAVLSRAGAFEVIEAGDLAAFEAALDGKLPDVVLSDYHLAGFDGLLVLEKVQARDALLPVVFVTGTGDEDIAVNVLKRGAADYVLKDRQHLRRLPQALLASVENARLRRERVQEAEMAQQRTERLRRQREALAELTARLATAPSDPGVALRAICEVAAQTLQVERVGVWRFNAARTALQSVETFARASGVGERGQVLEGARYPAYFAAVNSCNIIAAGDAPEDERTREFARGYLDVLGIGAMLDAPIRLGSMVDGVLCHEHVGGKRAWAPDEESFAVSLANLASLVLERAERESAEARLRKSETLLAEAEHLATLGSWELELVDPANLGRNPLRWSAEQFRIFGYEPDSFVPSVDFFRSRVHPDDLSLFDAAVEEGMRLGGYYTIDHRIVRPDGQVRALHQRATFVRDAESGAPLRIIGTSQDITERKDIIEALQRSVEDFRLLFTHNPMPMWVYDRETLRFLAVNRAAVAHYGYTAAEFLGMTIRDIRPAEDIPLLEKNILQQVEGFGRSGIWRHRRKSGEIINVRISSHGLRFEGRDAALVLAHDVTAEERSRAALLESEERFRHMADHAPVMVWVTDADGACTYISKSWTAFTGQSQEEALGLGWTKMVHPDDHARVERGFLEANEDEAEFRQEYRLRHLSGEYRWVIDAASARRAGDGSFLGYIGSVLDIDDRRRAEHALRDSEERFRQINETINEAFWMFDLPQERFIYISPAYEKIFGRSREVLYADPHSWKSAIHPDDAARVLGSIRSRQTTGDYDEEYRILRPDGTVRWIRDRGFPVHDENGQTYRLTGVTEDVTDRKEMAERFRQVQKMEALGKLSAGVAHDFNNLLSVIKGHLGLLQLKGQITPELKPSMQQIAEASDRAANPTRQLLTFSRQQVMETAEHNLNGLVTNLAKMLRRLLNETIDFSVHCAGEPLPIRADSGMVEQVLLNLVVNAGDAMPHGGKLVVRTAAVTITPDEVAAHPRRRPGEFACLSVSDTGVGIPPEILPRIFEPFFTTKGVGKGTGLGLATVFGVMEQHDGWAEVESSRNKGTTFHAYFPRQGRGTAPESPATNLPLTGGHEGILLVEDEENVRHVAEVALHGLGYRVFVAPHGAAALQLWQAHRHEVDLLLTDLVMPGGVNGRELAERLQTDRPDLPVIFMSGYSHEVAGSELELREGQNYLAKPFSLDRLASTLRTRLGNPR